MRAIFLIFAIAVAGCSTTKEAMQAVSNRYIGANIDDFFAENGLPKAKWQTKSGDVLYTWNSRSVSFPIPMVTTAQGGATGSRQSVTAVTTGGGTIDVFCELQIRTSEDGTIRNITPMVDTVGVWETSRCAEIFRKKTEVESP